MKPGEREALRDQLVEEVVSLDWHNIVVCSDQSRAASIIAGDFDRYADAVAACENKEVKRAWLAAWDAEYRLQHYARTWHAASEKWAEWAGEEEQLLAANKTAWLAAWDAEYRAQVTRAPLVEALEEISSFSISLSYEEAPYEMKAAANAALAAYEETKS